MRKAAAVVSFMGAFLIGALPGYLVGGAAEEAVRPGDWRRVEVSYTLTPVAPVEAVRAEDLIGTWSGTWGYEHDRCTIEINRVAGRTFYGTLKKEGAVITLEGYIDPVMRRVHFKETRVVRLGPAMSEWSLGLNTGTFSADARSLSGEGTDEWGTYGWTATRVTKN